MADYVTEKIYYVNDKAQNPISQSAFDDLYRCQGRFNAHLEDAKTMTRGFTTTYVYKGSTVMLTLDSGASRDSAKLIVASENEAISKEVFGELEAILLRE